MPFLVTLIESERGWGQRIDDTIYFKEFEAAKNYVVNFNSKNNLNYVPDWYMYATSPSFVETIPAHKKLHDEQ